MSQSPFAPSAWKYETFDRRNNLSNVALAGTGVSVMQAVPLQMGITIANLGWTVGTTAASGPTHHWMYIADSNLIVRGVSTDKTSTAITASSASVPSTITYALGANYVTAYDGIYYVGLAIAVSTTMPTALGMATTIGDAIVPVLSQSQGSALTTPYSVAQQLTSPTVGISKLYYFLLS